MKFTLSVNQKQAIDLGITSLNQAVIFDLLTGLSTWATPVLLDGEVYYWVARQVICDELPLLSLKPDTVYRHLKSLAGMGLILHVKSGKKDCVKLTKKGAAYYIGNKSEKDEIAMSEINPKNAVEFGNKSEKPPELGNISEKNSDLNPTYQLTKNKSVKSSSKGAAVDNFPLRDALAFFENDLNEPVFKSAQMSSARVAKMLSDWAEKGVQVSDVKLVVGQVLLRGVDLNSPLYLDGPMCDWLTEKSGKGEKRRQAVKVPRDDVQLEAWAKGHGFSRPKKAESFAQYRGRLNSELQVRAGAA